MENPKSITLTGAAAVVPLASAGGAKWVRLYAPSGNSGDVLVGGSEVSSSAGFPIPKGTGILMPPSAEPFSFYDLATINAYIASSDELCILYGG